MLSNEWHELEMLNARIDELRHRHVIAETSKNIGLTDALKEAIALAERQCEQLIEHISVRLSAIAAD